MRIYHGIIARQPHTVEKRKGLLKEQCAEFGKGRLRYFGSLDENGWADSLKCYCHLRNIQDRVSDGKTPYETRFGSQEDGASKACQKQAAAGSRGSRTCVCASTFVFRGWHTQEGKGELTSCRGTV